MAEAELKLLAALPADWQDEARRMSSRFHLDPRGWFQPDRDGRGAAPIADAVWSERRIAVSYESWTKVTDRVLEPLGLVLKGGIWYVVAQHRRAAAHLPPREHPRAGRSPTRPSRGRKDFDLAAYWAESTAQFEKDVYKGVAEVRATERGVKRLKDISSTVPARRSKHRARRRTQDGWITVTLPIEEIELDRERDHPRRRRGRGAVAARTARGDGRRRATDGGALRASRAPRRWCGARRRGR